MKLDNSLFGIAPETLNWIYHLLGLIDHE